MSPMSEQTLVTTQPAVTVEPTVASEVPTTAVQNSSTTKSATESLPLLTLGVQKDEAPQQPRYRKPSGFRFGLFRFLRIVNRIFSGLLRVLLIVFGAIGVVILFAFIAAVSFGSVAANGAVIMLIGNGILRAAHLSHYTTNKIAAEIGAVGGLVSSVVFGATFNCFLPGNNQDENKPSWVTLITTVLVGTLSGTLGAAILKHNHVDLKGMDVLHATRAGALGGAIMGPGLIFIVPVMFLVLGIILSPLWIALMCGVEWIQTKSSESWTDNSHSYSICYCVGTCGDDPEINAEMDYLDAIQRRHRNF